MTSFRDAEQRVKRILPLIQNKSFKDKRDQHQFKVLDLVLKNAHPNQKDVWNLVVVTNMKREPLEGRFIEFSYGEFIENCIQQDSVTIGNS